MTPKDCSKPGFPVLHQLPKPTQTHIHWVSDAFNLSQHQAISNELALRIGWPKYWSFSFSISPSNEYLELISFRIDWFDLLAVQRALKSLFQHHSSKTSILQHSTFFIIQLSHPYITIGKTKALTRWTFAAKSCLCFWICYLGWLAITFLPRSKHLLTSWLQSLSAVILEPKKIKSHYFHCFPTYLPWSDGTVCYHYFLNFEF